MHSSHDALHDNYRLPLLHPGHISCLLHFNNTIRHYVTFTFTYRLQTRKRIVTSEIRMSASAFDIASLKN